MLILDGKKLREEYRPKLAARIVALESAPTLLLIQAGDNAASDSYINQKKLFAASIGAKVVHIHFHGEVESRQVETAILEGNDDPEIDGIIIQLPLPAQLDKQMLINLIAPKKDVDGLTDANQDLLAAGRQGEQLGRVPATAKAVMLILSHYGLSVAGKKAVVLGRSRLVGSPTAKLLAQAGATVEVCHSQTADCAAIAREADILVVAIGKPELVGASYIKEGAVVVDVGITRVENRGLVGDVDHAAAENTASALTPVPGGVGPVTVLSLFDTLIASAEEKENQ